MEMEANWTKSVEFAAFPQRRGPISIYGLTLRSLDAWFSAEREANSVTEKKQSILTQFMKIADLETAEAFNTPVTSVFDVVCLLSLSSLSLLRSIL